MWADERVENEEKKNGIEISCQSNVRVGNGKKKKRLSLLSHSPLIRLFYIFSFPLALVLSVTLFFFLPLSDPPKYLSINHNIQTNLTS